MELYDYWRLIVRNLPILILTSIIGFSGAVYVNYATTPTYSASADVFVTTPSVTLDVGSLATGSNFSEQRVVSYAQIISGPATLEPVIEKLGLDVTPEELADDVHATAPNGTVLISISVDSLDPNKAAAIANAVAEQFEQTVQQLELTSATTATNIKVTPVRQAKPNYTPSAPKKSLNLALGLILGFALGAGIVLLLMFFDRTVKNEEQLGEIPLVGTVRFDATARDKPLLSDLSKYSVRAEAFRQMRTNLRLADENSIIRSLAVTSALPNEGKTTTSLNLALSLSDSGKKVALIDSDLRRPQLNLFLELSKESHGVADIIKSDALLAKFLAHPEKMMQKVNPNFFVLTSGQIPANAAELVGSASFKQVIDASSKHFDIVILDCPPTLPIADAAVTARFVDGVLLVVKAGKTSIKQFQGSVASLQNVDAHIIGCVLNMIPTNRSADEYGYRYGYGGYRNYYGYKGRKNDKSMYSPLEPYGPSITVNPQSPKVDGHDEELGVSDLHEISFEIKESNGILRRNISRGTAIVYERLAKQLQEQTSGKLSNSNTEDRPEVKGEKQNAAEPGSSKLGISNASLVGAIKKLLATVKPDKQKSNSSLTRINMSSESQKQQEFIDEFFKSIDEKERRTVKNASVKKSPKNYAKTSKTVAKKKVSVKKKSSAKPITKKSANKK